MSPPADEQKAAKKAAKAAAKIAKKQRAPSTDMFAVPPAVASVPPAAEPSSEPTPAERAADAAERKVIWEQRRFWLTVVSVLVALAALLVTLFSKGNW